MTADAIDPMTADSMTTGPMTTGPMTTGPMTTGPMTADSMTSDPVTADPVTAAAEAIALASGATPMTAAAEAIALASAAVPAEVATPGPAPARAQVQVQAQAQVPARAAYRDLLVTLMAADPRVYCLDSDTGLFTGVDFGPAADRYINVGIAEHNLMGVAAGLAASGKIPFVNTMATFATTRALEAVKIDIAYNKLPVRIVATHGGLAAGHLGPSHHSLEDLAIMRTLPGFTVVVPGDSAAAEQAVLQTLDLPGPAYIRLGRAATPPIGHGPITVGQAQRLRDGSDIAIFACGPYPVLAALGAAEELAGRGIDAAVINMHTVKPLDTAAVLAEARRMPALITVEEHWRTAGFGSLIAETLCDHEPTRLTRIGMPETFAELAGDQAYLLDHYRISHKEITTAALALLAGAGKITGGARDDADLSRV
jgi:transketolase